MEPPEEFETWRGREAELQAQMGALSDEDVAPYAGLTIDEVRARAVEVEEALEALAREHGGASTVSGSAAGDWVKLRWLMEDAAWPKVGEMAFGEGDRWARRLAAHAALGDDVHSGVVPAAGAVGFSWFEILANWFRRRVLHQDVQPLFKPLPRLATRRRELVAKSRAVPRDSREWRLARSLTKLFNARLLWYARVAVMPLPDGWAMTERWGFWSSGTSVSYGESLLDADALVNVVLGVQSFVANHSARAWPLQESEEAMRRAHRADPEWIRGHPMPDVQLEGDRIRIWFGNRKAPLAVLDAQY